MKSNFPALCCLGLLLDQRFEGGWVSFQLALTSRVTDPKSAQQAHLVVGVSNDIVLHELGRHVQLHEKLSQVCPLLQLRDPRQQPV